MSYSKTPQKFKIWQLEKNSGRRFLTGHPWIYSNEIQGGPNGIQAGELIELRDHRGEFLAYGYGNPHSLISFRVLSRNKNDQEVGSIDFLKARFERAKFFRENLGLENYSYRLCYGEADELPGLIIDRYLLSGKNQGVVFVIQAHTAGADLFLPQIIEILSKEPHIALVIKNNLNVRVLEKIEKQEPRVIFPHSSNVNVKDLENCQIKIKMILKEDFFLFDVDLVHGQKTGFFLDQAANIELSALRLKNLHRNILLSSNKKTFKILDLCSYVGQWSVQLGKFYQEEGLKSGFDVQVTLFDASQKALDIASKNLSRVNVKSVQVVGDVLKDLSQFADQSFDLVISDPPALIKNRKDIPQGMRAYLQLATQAFRLVKNQGGIICCSCSGLLEEDQFVEQLLKGAQRNKKLVHWIGKGSPSPDHPIHFEFPEGKYLKAWIGIVSSS